MKKLILIVIGGILLATFTTHAIAAMYDLKTITPAIQQALDARRGRFNELQSLKSQGIVGENKAGYVEVVTSDETAHAIINAENQDRKLIYQAIADQNGLTSALGTIEAVFAEVQRSKAQPGEHIQLENGAWVTK
ncbi:MAG: YdbL family protein [Candidatus Omnitrophica bacterium]|nr:YdbL family protein [Candidatus Omnitrophota bacterium]